MAFTQNDIDLLKRAMASGRMRVRYADGREVTYRSLSDMRELLKMMTGEVAGASGASARARSSVAGF